MQVEVRTGPRLLRPPRVFYGWYIVAAGMGLHLWISIAWVYGMQLFFTPIIQTFHWSRTAMSFAFSLQRLEGSIVGPIEGFLVDRFGPRRLVLAGAFVTGLGLIAMSMIEALWMFYGSVLLLGLGTSAIAGLPRTWAIVQWFRRLRGQALGIGSSGAVISGPLLIIVVWLIGAFGWRQAFLILGLATWAICLPLALVFRSRPHQYGHLPDGDPAAMRAEGPGVGEAPRGRPSAESSDAGLTVRQALRTQAFWVLILIFSAQGMGVSALIVHLIPYFESIHFTTAEAASVLGFFTVLSVFGRVGGGWVIDRFDKRLVLAGLLACQAAAFLLLVNITAYWQVVPFALLYGTAFGGMLPSSPAIVSTFFGTRNFGAIQGLIGTGTVLPGMVAPVLLGWAFDTTGSYVPGLYVLMGAAALAIPVTFLARPPRQMEKVVA